MKKQDLELLTLFPAASPVNPSPLPGSGEARRMTVTSGRKCSELFQNSGPIGSLVRTLLESSLWRSTRCWLTWKTKVTPSKRLLFRLVPSTPRTGGTDARLSGMVKMWSTPKASDYKGSGPVGSKSADHDLKKHNLKGVVMFYPTPTTGAGLCGGTGNFQQLKKLQQAGQISEEERRNMSQGNGGQLNPTWVEWLMGFPLGWTDLNVSETP